MLINSAMKQFLYLNDPWSLPVKTDFHTSFVGFYYTPRKLCLWWVYCFHVVCASVSLSVTLCFFNILKSHCWIFIKPCKHVHIRKTNTLNKKVRARGQFYYSYFPL